MRIYRADLGDEYRVVLLETDFTTQLIKMPEIFRAFGFRFLFYSNDHLPIHVHVRNGDGEARFSINPVQLLDNHGLELKDLKFAEGLIEENEDIIEQRWKEFFQQ